MISSEVKDQKVELVIKQNKQWHSKVITCSRGLVLWLRQMKYIGIPIVVTVSSAWLLGARWNLLMPIVILNIMLIVAEIFNTSIEKVCDEVNRSWSKGIKDAKDISSSSVLVIGLTLLAVWLWVIIDSMVRY